MAKAELGVILQDLRGKAGNAVFSKSRDGIVLKPRVKGRNPNTAAQQAVRHALSTATSMFKNFTSAQNAAWSTYAQTITKHNPVTGKSYHPTAINAFTALAAKFLLVNPTGTVPTTPPATSFPGDTITLTTTGATGKVTFTASGANAANVKTELLLQPLASANRRPQRNGYRSKAYVAFASGSLSFDVLVPAGYYAAAYRFVNALTGQETQLIPLPEQQVSFSVSVGGTNEAKSSAKKAA